MREYTFWPRKRALPEPAQVHDVFGSYEEADDALSTHIATNIDQGLDRTAYVVLTREVGDWHE